MCTTWSPLLAIGSDTNDSHADRSGIASAEHAEFDSSTRIVINGQEPDGLDVRYREGGQQKEHECEYCL
jgi:hypothetical protein